MATDKISTHKITEKSDCDLSLRLEKLFHEYVALYTKLYKDGGENSGVPDERIEMAIKLEAANQEMSELVTQLQNLQSDTKLEADVAPHAISASQRSSMVALSMGA